MAPSFLIGDIIAIVVVCSLFVSVSYGGTCQGAIAYKEWFFPFAVDYCQDYGEPILASNNKWDSGTFTCNNAASDPVATYYNNTDTCNPTDISYVEDVVGDCSDVSDDCTLIKFKFQEYSDTCGGIKKGPSKSFILTTGLNNKCIHWTAPGNSASYIKVYLDPIAKTLEYGFYLDSPDCSDFIFGSTITEGCSTVWDNTIITFKDPFEETTSTTLPPIPTTTENDDHLYESPTTTEDLLFDLLSTTGDNDVFTTSNVIDRIETTEDDDQTPSPTEEPTEEPTPEPVARYFDIP